MSQEVFGLIQVQAESARASERSCTTGGCQWWEERYWTGEDC